MYLSLLRCGAVIKLVELNLQFLLYDIKGWVVPHVTERSEMIHVGLTNINFRLVSYKWND
jgi:hypothetical protein